MAVDLCDCVFSTVKLVTILQDTSTCKVLPLMGDVSDGGAVAVASVWTDA